MNNTIRYDTIRFDMIRSNSIRYDTIQYNTMQYNTIQYNTYRKSYERECISGFMSTSDVLKFLKIARAVGECNLRTFKTSRVLINPEMHSRSYDFLLIIYSTKLLLRSSLHALRTTSKALQWFPKYSHVLFEPIKNIML